jgi:hypothetical protein
VWACLPTESSVALRASTAAVSDVALHAPTAAMPDVALRAPTAATSRPDWR